MATGTQENTGCIFTERGQQCHKLIEGDTTMCPHHNLLMAHRQQQKEERKREREAEAKKKPVRGVRAHRTAEHQSYYTD